MGKHCFASRELLGHCATRGHWMAHPPGIWRSSNYGTLRAQHPVDDGAEADCKAGIYFGQL